MLFDDRLATVLRHRADSEATARAQYRQLLDLLGHSARGADPALIAAGRMRLAALGELIPARERGRMVADAGSRLRDPEFLSSLAEDEPEIAAAALANATLSAEDWVALIPTLPVRARGFLRHRRNLPREAGELLDRLGVRDRVLPEPEHVTRREVVTPPVSTLAPAPSPAAGQPERSPESIGALVERIQAYTKARESREGAADAPRLPLGESDGATADRPIDSFVVGIDVSGRIDLADAAIAPMVVGTQLTAREATTTGRASFSAAFRNRQPVRGAMIGLRGAPRIAGDWLLDATPRFHREDGRFLGFAGRMRRAVPASAADEAESAADRIRQLLHELRTPVNAIQGFAEVIQQQLFGATPHEYRALAATIAGDAARMLAGFDELDRLARLESGALDLVSGTSDFAAIAAAQVDQLQTVLSARVARIEAQWPARPAMLPIAEAEAEMLAWRIFATIASAIGAGELLALEVAASDGKLAMRCALPASLAGSKDLFSTDTKSAAGAVSAGIFGPGFALRLARAEARSAGGDLEREEDALILTLPLLTTPAGETSPRREARRAAG